MAAETDQDLTRREEVRRHALRLADELERTARDIRSDVDGLEQPRNTPTKVAAAVLQAYDRRRSASAIVWQLVAALESQS